MITSIYVISGRDYSRLEYVKDGRAYRCWYHGSGHNQKAKDAALVLRFAIEAR